MSNHEMPPQAIVDPGLAIVTTGNLRGNLLSRLQAECAPVKLSHLKFGKSEDQSAQIDEELKFLADPDIGMVLLTNTTAQALHPATGKPYTRMERREIVEMARPVQEGRYTVPIPTHTPTPGKVRTAPVKAKKSKPTGPCTHSRVVFTNAQREAGRRYRESIWPTIEKLRNEGLSIRKIHMATSHSEQTITKILKERVKGGWTDPCGDKFIPVPITEHDRENARKMRMAGSSIRAICKYLGRDRKSVLRALLEVVK